MASMSSACAFSAARSAYLVFGVLFAVPSIPLVMAARQSSAFYLPLALVVVGYGLVCYWLSRFRLEIEGGELRYSSLFTGRRSVPLSTIVSVGLVAKSGPFESPFTVSVKTSSGEEVRINGKVFSREAVNRLFALTGSKDSSSHPPGPVRSKASTGGAIAPKKPIIFAIGEDGVLAIHADVAAVRRDCEGIDVESQVWEFFDVTGLPLEPVFVQPNKVTKVLGKIVSVESGVFDLVPASNQSNPTLLESLTDGIVLDPNPHFASLAELREFLNAARIPGEAGAR